MPELRKKVLDGKQRRNKTTSVIFIGAFEFYQFYGVLTIDFLILKFKTNEKDY